MRAKCARDAREMRSRCARDAREMEHQLERAHGRLVGGRLKMCLSGGGAISAEVQEWVRTALDCPLVQALLLLWPRLCPTPVAPLLLCPCCCGPQRLAARPGLRAHRVLRGGDVPNARRHVDRHRRCAQSRTHPSRIGRRTKTKRSVGPALSLGDFPVQARRSRAWRSCSTQSRRSRTPTATRT